MIFRRSVLLAGFMVVLAAGLSACKEEKTQAAENTAVEETQAVLPAGGEKTDFQCGDIVVTFVPVGEDKADMRIANVAYAMERVVSASGAKYQNLGDPSTVFWNKGDMALVTVEGADLPECQAKAPEQKPLPPPGQIRNVEWLLEDLNGGGIIDRSHVTMILGDDGRVAGSAGCNRYSSAYELEGETLSVSPQMMSTMMACPEALMNQERRFTQTLVAVRSFHFDETGALILTAEGGDTLTFRPDR